MAKALIGYLNSDLRTPGHVALENSRLKARVRELEDLVLKLKLENDTLVARAAELVDELARSPGPGHQYLTTHPGDDAIVVVSKGEYGDDVLGR